MIGNGIYDLCTPFGQAEYDIDHLGLPAPLRRNIAFTYYPAGHMLYTSPESLARFSGDLKRFYATDAPGWRDSTNALRRPCPGGWTPDYM
ncbi:hypothetical protein V6584_02165 [Bifidobacterium sp. IMAU50987]